MIPKPRYLVVSKMEIARRVTQLFPKWKELDKEVIE